MNQDWWIEIAVQHTLATNDLTSYEDNVRKLETVALMREPLEADESFEKEAQSVYQAYERVMPQQQAYVRHLHWRFKKLMKRIGNRMPEAEEVILGGMEEDDRAKGIKDAVVGEVTPTPATSTNPEVASV